jgi:predicted metalloprotease with PDZ domain
MIVPDVTGEVIVQMPAWNALYQIRDFSDRVRQVEAFTGAERAPIEKMDKQTWRIQGNGTIKIQYAIYWDEVGPFASQLNSEHAFINPAMILMYVPGRRSEEVVLEMPDLPNGWRVASGAPAGSSQASRGTVFTTDAKTYEDLADGPIEAGKFEEFELSGVPGRVTVVIHGDNWKRKKVEEDLKRICQYELKLMEGAPFERYTFILHIGKGSGGGGMEHADSTAIGALCGLPRE